MFRKRPIDFPQDVTVRRSRRAKRLSLRVSSLDGRATLTVPAQVSDRVAAQFLEEKRHWLEAQKSRIAPPRLVAEATALPFEGLQLPIQPGKVRGAKLSIDGEQLIVPDNPEKRARAIRALFKVAARDRLVEASDHYAARVGRSFKKITLRDTRSRWGSCTSDGGLMFSWRLIMAPPEVLKYVAAHEVAHLVEMNHSPAFWSLVEDLFPNHNPHREWLRSYGTDLHSWDFSN